MKIVRNGDEDKSLCSNCRHEAGALRASASTYFDGSDRRNGQQGTTHDDHCDALVFSFDLWAGGGSR